MSDIQTYMDLRRGLRTLEASAAVGGWAPVLTGTSQSERVYGQSVSVDFFSVLGVKPALGRDFRPDEDAQDHNRVVILSHRLWQRQFGGDPAIVDRTILLSGREYLVAGVLPSRSRACSIPTAELWRPLGYNETMESACRTCRHLRMIGASAPGLHSIRPRPISAPWPRESLRSIRRSMRSRHARGAAARGDRGRGPAGAPADAGRRGVRTPDRLRQHRQSHAGAHHRTAT